MKLKHLLLIALCMSLGEVLAQTKLSDDEISDRMLGIDSLLIKFETASKFRIAGQDQSNVQAAEAYSSLFGPEVVVYDVLTPMMDAYKNIVMPAKGGYKRAEDQALDIVRMYKGGLNFNFNSIAVDYRDAPLGKAKIIFEAKSLGYGLNNEKVESITIAQVDIVYMPDLRSWKIVNWKDLGSKISVEQNNNIQDLAVEPSLDPKKNGKIYIIINSDLGVLSSNFGNLAEVLKMQTSSGINGLETKNASLDLNSGYYSLGIGSELMFGKKSQLGLCVGLNYSQTQTSFLADSLNYHITPQTIKPFLISETDITSSTHIENLVRTSQVEEIYKLTSLNVPIALKYYYPVSKRMKVFFGGGVNMGLSQNIRTQGNSTIDYEEIAYVSTVNDAGEAFTGVISRTENEFVRLFDNYNQVALEQQAEGHFVGFDQRVETSNEKKMSLGLSWFVKGGVSMRLSSGLDLQFGVGYSQFELSGEEDLVFRTKIDEDYRGYGALVNDWNASVISFQIGIRSYLASLITKK